MRFLIKFSYDGTNYSGFQTQPGLNTIQEKLEEAIAIINNGQKTNIVATGRTDKGVHALCQYAHADIDVDITEYKLKRAMNSNLPDDIHVIETHIVPNDFHARYYVKSKEYKYYINLGEYNPLERNYVFQYNYTLNVDKMKDAIQVFLGTHDFRAFVTESKEKENCVRTINYVNVEQVNNKLIITFRGDGFLRYQVRNMVGILIRVGENKISTEDVERILMSKDRTTTGKTAPPEGLYLTNVSYE
ncbi:MAG: tRNA pseudouridine(38-40) synthase TruA [Bacilli bacterium]|nr:tRNA pseudouridine(38-40) synthase TruA [Bacilli bacterium]